MTLENILEVLDLTEEEAEGLLPLSNLVTWTNKTIAEHGEEWLKANAHLLRVQWLYIQSM
jgi:hypothetical protein